MTVSRLSLDAEDVLSGADRMETDRGRNGLLLVAGGCASISVSVGSVPRETWGLDDGGIDTAMPMVDWKSLGSW